MRAFDYEPKYQKTNLENGVRIVTEHHPYTRSTCAGIFVDLGSRDEPENMLGATHLLEHMVWKGTKTRSAYQLVKEIEEVGGDVNAYTHREATCHHSSTLRENIHLSIDVLADVISNAECTEEEFQREKQVVLQEIDVSAEDFEETIFDGYFENVFSKHSLGRPILGTKESLADINKDSLFKFYSDNYCGSNLVVSVTGHVDHNQVVELVSERLGKKAVSGQLEPRVAPNYNAFRKVIQKPSEQIHMLLGLPSAAFTKDNRFEAILLNTLLGGGMTSRLYQKVREQKGLAYSVYSYLQAYVDCGLITIYAATSQDHWQAVIEIMQEEFKTLLREGVRKEELEQFKRQIMGEIMLSADDVENRMNSLGVNEMIFGSYRPVDQVLSDINKISQESIMQFTNEYFAGLNFGALILGDLPVETTEASLKSLF